MKEIKNITDLEFDDLNSNLHNERGMDLLVRSIEKTGIGRSIVVDRNGKIIAGNGTTEALVELGMESVEVVKTHGDKLVVVQRMDLDLDTDEKARRLALYDNRVSQVNLTWNPESLKALEEDMGVTKFGMWTSKEFKRDFGEKLKASVEEELAANSGNGTSGSTGEAVGIALNGPGTASGGDFGASGGYGVRSISEGGNGGLEINQAAQIVSDIGKLLGKLENMSDDTLPKIRPELIDLKIVLDELLDA